MRFWRPRRRVRPVENGVAAGPIMADLDSWFAALDQFADVPFIEDGRRQPPMPERDGRFE